MAFLIGFLVGVLFVPICIYIALEGERLGWW
jgi:hypothetical protein